MGEKIEVLTATQLSEDEIREYPPYLNPSRVNDSKIYLSHLISNKAEIFTFGKPKDWKYEYRSNLEFLGLLKENQVEKIYIPRCSTFNGILSDPSDFKDEFLTHGMKFMFGCNTDGLEIPSGSAALIYTADCPTIVYHDITNDVLIAAHAGLGSVVDLGFIKTGIESRNHESVVDEIMRYVGYTKEYEIFILCGIHHESFIYDIIHPKFGHSNFRIIMYLLETYGLGSVPRGLNHDGISISNIIKHQFQKYGINEKKIHSDGINTYEDDRFWSHSRYFHKELGYCGRNGILVLHKK